ncbi:hypothetical protein BDR04DRAFT_14412 [Suillus decipiens]|nr:hypothetical protein BDR04DRAFT_14412 [Suillus decipiens]
MVIIMIVYLFTTDSPRLHGAPCFSQDTLLLSFTSTRCKLPKFDFRAECCPRRKTGHVAVFCRSINVYQSSPKFTDELSHGCK